MSLIFPLSLGGGGFVCIGQFAGRPFGGLNPENRRPEMRFARSSDYEVPTYVGIS